jgi:two-component system sensor histidine kinase YesM
MSLISNLLYTHLIRNELDTYYETSLTFAERQLDETLGKLTTITNTIRLDRDVVAYSQFLSRHLSWNEKLLFDKINLISVSNVLKNQFTLYLKNPDKIIVSGRGIYTPNDTERLITDSYLSTTDTWTIQQKNGINSIVYVSGTEDSLGNAYVICEMSIPIEEIKKVMSDTSSMNTLNPFLVDSHGAFAFLGRKEENLNEQTRITKELDLKDKKEGELFFPDTQTRVLYRPADSNGFTVGIFFDENDYLQPLRLAEKIPLYFMIMLFSLGAVVLFFLSRKVIRPVNRLVYAMQNVVESNFSIRITVEGESDIDRLYGNFNTMIDQIEILINQVFKADLANKNAQLKLLQSQINPHFLNNCMNFIYQAAQNEDYTTCSEMSLYLSRYYRIATRSVDDMVTLKEEIEHTNVFLKIHQMRFPNLLEVNYDISVESQSILIPRLSILPIAENCIVHGMNGAQTKKKVLIRTMLSDSFMTISVVNTGSQIDEAQLRTLNQSFEDSGITADHLGLMNISGRLRIQYGPSAKILLRNVDGGIETIVVIPIA